MLQHTASKMRSFKAPPPLIFAPEATNTQLQLYLSAPNSSNEFLIVKSIQHIQQLLRTTRVHPHRLIYCIAGELFSHSSPYPFGGPKMKPGYSLFDGLTPDHLLQFIVVACYTEYWKWKGNSALHLIVSTVNSVLNRHREYGNKDKLDELMLKGMKKAGHIGWFGAMYIPKYLQHVEMEEEGGSEKKGGVLFTPNQGRNHNP